MTIFFDVNYIINVSFLSLAPNQNEKLMIHYNHVLFHPIHL